MHTPRKILALALGLSLAVLACSSEEEVATPPETPTASSTAQPAATPEPGAIEVTVEALQKTLPKDIRMYPVESLQTAEELPLNGSDDVGVSMQTSDSVEDVVEYYRGVANDGDWSIQMDVVDEMSGVLEARKGDRKLIVLTVANGVDPTVIAVKVMKNPAF